MKLKLPLSPKTLNILVLIFGVLVLAAVLYYSCANREGFEGSIPAATQTSSIPSDTPGAVTTDPTLAKPQTKDIQATLDELDLFYMLVQTNHGANLPEDSKRSIDEYVRNKETLYSNLRKALQDETSELSLGQVTELRSNITKLNALLRGSGADGAAAPIDYKPTVVAGESGVITLEELKNLVKRIEEEHLRLANLRSTSATLLARQTQLEKLAADIRELIGAVERKEMKLEDVPISPSSAEAFLKQMNENKSLPPLIEPRGELANGLQQSNVAPTPSTIPGGADALYGLLDNAKYLKWNLEVKLEYDPKLAARDNLIKRLESIERRLSALAVSETPISKEMYDIFMKELETIHGIVADGNKKNDENADRRQRAVDRPATLYSRTAMADPDPASSGVPDVMIRPGFVMNDDTIQRRASASAFDDSLVGGADYKKRSQDLCRQIRSANLGDPVQFGCISDPDSVSPAYSWKGNFTMICNRLGDTWGGWYPEMFGCPKYDPTQKFKATMI